jgi:lysyl-tRNA synthetase class 2
MTEEPRDNPLRAEKKRKLQAMRELGLDPYPYTFDRSISLTELKEKYAHLGEGEKAEGEIHKIAGRLITKRPMGKAAFFNIQDSETIFQGYLRKQDLADQANQFFENIDIGDIVGLEGFVFRTQKGELSLHCTNFWCLTKSIEPLPEKFHGLQDVEAKYRYRHLDLISDMEARKRFVTRSKIVAEIREFLTDRGFIEVETPVLQPIYGGASAKPFVTHHNALDRDLFLRISPELYLKRLIVGGMDKVFEVSKNFRNEGIDRSHNPEFTLLEWYEAYTDYNYQMKQYEDLVVHVVRTIKGETKFTYQGKEIDFTPPWRRLTVYDGVKEYAGIDPREASAEDLFKRAKELGSELEAPLSHGEMVMELFELAAEKHLWNPTFVLDHPEEISPLTKKHRSVKGLVERFEPFAAYMEIGNAYSELNDPEDQRARLKAQESKRREDKNSEAHPMDEDFLHAIDVGMPPTGGVGLGIERLVMLLTDQNSIRDVILFPTMKPVKD